MQCAHCNSVATLRCSKCHLVYYCTKAHQQTHWSTHKHECFKENARSKFQTMVDVLESDVLQDVVAREQKMTVCEQFALKRYKQVRMMTDTNADCARIAEGEAMLKMLSVQKSMQSKLMSCILFMVAAAYNAQGCEAAANKMLVPFLPPGTLKDSAQPTPTQKDLDMSYVKILTSVDGFQRSQEKLLEGKIYFQEQSKHKGLRIILNASKGGYEVLCNKARKFGEFIFQEEACLVCTLNYTRCHHCTKLCQQYAMLECRGKCGLIFCSAQCENKAWDFYHEFLCDVECIVRFKAMCDYILMAAKSSVGKFPLLQFKILGAALKHKAHILTMPPFCYFHRGTYTWSLSAFPKQLNYLYGVLTSPHLTSHMVRDDIDFAWLLNVTALLMANTFTMKSGKDTLNPATFGTGMFLGSVTSLINHSCHANAKWDADSISGKMRIVALRDIKSGEPVTISYGDSSEKRLEMVYGFKCTCEMCQ